MHAYAVHHDRLLVLDELFCRVVTLEHRVRIWNESEQPPRVRDSIKALNRALKWAWLAREEEEHTSGKRRVCLPESAKGEDVPPEQPCGTEA